MLSVCKTVSVLGAACLAYVASPAMAAPEPSTRLVRCDSGNCLLVTGYRESAASEVSINGQAVKVEGKRRWQVRLPVETVREWSAPWARTIQVQLHDSATKGTSSEEAVLPIGLMGHTDLASLVVGVHQRPAGQAIASR
jgi:hypothetical protein